VPVEPRIALPLEFSVRLEIAALGPLTIARIVQISPGSVEALRPPRLVRQADPEIYRIMLNLQGHNLNEQDQRASSLGIQDLAIFDSSHPFHVRRLPEAGCRHEFVMVTFPRHLLSVSPNLVRSATSTRMAGSRPLGALVGAFALRLAEDVNDYEPADTARLSTAFLDLVAVWLSRELDTSARLPVRSHRQVLLMQVQAYILCHLGEPTLTPNTIAAAHHISTRTLHAVFEAGELTVAAWIRDRRLDRCRRDLTDPGCDHLPVGAVGARWGLADPAHFSRMFRMVYGMSPRAYRQRRHLVG
jgi:AraC-like DNA-binding protein